MGVHVARTRPPYPPEFRAEAVRLLRTTGKTPREVAETFGVSRQTVANWARQAYLDDGLRDDGLTTAEREELRRLRREVGDLREEREILKKAAGPYRGLAATSSRGRAVSRQGCRGHRPRAAGEATG